MRKKKRVVLQATILTFNWICFFSVVYWSGKMLTQDPNPLYETVVYVTSSLRNLLSGKPSCKFSLCACSALKILVCHVLWMGKLCLYVFSYKFIQWKLWKLSQAMDIFTACFNWGNVWFSWPENCRIFFAVYLLYTIIFCLQKYAGKIYEKNTDYLSMVFGGADLFNNLP